MKHLLFGIGAVVVWGGAGWSEAQCPPPPTCPTCPIVVEVDGVLHSRWASETAICIDVGTLSTLMLVRIYDDSANGSLPANSIGPVTIQGTAGYDTYAQLQVLVADESQTTFPELAADLLSAGCKNFGSSTIGLSIPDATLRLATQLALSATDTIQGEISVGQALRVQAGFEVAPPRGVIASDITTESADDWLNLWVYTGWKAIEHVKAGKGVSGTIRSSRQPLPVPLPSPDPGYVVFFNRPRSIGAVVLGPATGEGVDGITGDILTEHGKIDYIVSTGPVGTAQRASRIYSRDGIRQVRASDGIDLTGVSALTDADFHVDVQAAFEDGTAFPISPTADLEQLRRLGVIETKGDIFGTIRAWNVGKVDLGPTTDQNHSGIYAWPADTSACTGGGDIYADIDIKYVCEGNIVGRTIRGKVTVGRMMEGAIVGYDIDALQVPASQNTTPEINIGHGALFDPEFASFPRAFTGSAWTCQFLDLRDCAQIMSLYTAACDDLSAALSVIAAHRIATLRINDVTVDEKPHEPDSASLHTRVPLIESRRIDNLFIGNLREGVIWSGRTDSTNPDDWYTRVDQATISCVGANGNLWIKDYLSIDVKNSLVGRVHVPVVPESSLIRIGGALLARDTALDQSDLCECSLGGFVPGPDTPVCTQEDFEPQSEPALRPRYSERADFGAIRIAQSQGLHGQIIINANGAYPAEPSNPTVLAAFAEEYWSGKVEIGLTEPTGSGAITLQPTPILNHPLPTTPRTTRLCLLSSAAAPSASRPSPSTAPPATRSTWVC